MSAQDFFEDDLLDLIFTNVAAPNVGDAGGLQPSVGAGSFFTSLHTALPAESVSDQTNLEATYTPYARIGVARSLAGWTVAAGVVDNDAAITFPGDRGIRHRDPLRARLRRVERGLPQHGRRPRELARDLDGHHARVRRRRSRRLARLIPGPRAFGGLK